MPSNLVFYGNEPFGSNFRGARCVISIKKLLASQALRKVHALALHQHYVSAGGQRSG